MKNILVSILLFFLLAACSKKSVNEHLTLAQQAMSENNYETAVIELKNAALLEPKNGEVRFLLGQSYFELDQLNSASKELERTLKVDYSTSEVLPLLSKIYQRTGQSERLFELTYKAGNLKSKDLAQLKLYQIEAYVGLGQHEKAQKLIDEIKRIPNAEEYNELAQVYHFITKQHARNAFSMLDRILAKVPTQQDALKLKAQLHINYQQTEQAVSTYQKYIDAYPKDNDIKFILARLYSRLKQTEKAEPVVDDLLANYPNQPLLLQLKATIKARQQDHKQAFHYAKRALTLIPEDTPSQLIAGVSAYMLKDFKKADEYLSLIAGLLPSNHLALRLLADTQLRLGKSLEANDTVQRFKTLSENDTNLISNIGSALLREGETKKAKALLDKQSSLLTEDEVNAPMAHLKLSLNDATGILDLEKIMKENKLGDKNNEVEIKKIETTLAQAYFSTGEFDKALEIANKWQQSEDVTTQIKGYIISAKTYLKQKSPEKATQAYQKALALEPANPGIQLALTTLESNNIKEQFTAVNELLTQHPKHLPTVLKHFLLSKQLGVPEKMTSHLAQLIKTTPENNTLLKIALAKILLLENESNKAISLFEEVKTEQAQPFWANLADAYIKTKQYPKAIALFKSWFEQQPNQPDALMGMLKTMHLQGESVKALELTNHYIDEVGGKSVDVKLMQLFLLSHTQQYALLEKKILALPSDLLSLPFVKGLQGHLYLLDNNTKQAEPLLKTAYSVDPSTENVRRLYKVISKNSGEAAAITFLTEHVNKKPNDEVSLMVLAQITAASNPNKAKQLYGDLLKINPKNFIAHNNLANLLVTLNQVEQAYDHAFQAYELRPKEGAVLDTLAEIELKLNKNSDALKHTTAAVNLLKNNVTDGVMFNYLEALFRNNEHKLAVRKLDEYQVKTETGQVKIDELVQKYK